MQTIQTRPYPTTHTKYNFQFENQLQVQLNVQWNVYGKLLYD